MKLVNPHVKVCVNPYIHIRRDDPIRAADQLLKNLGPGYCQLLWFALHSFHKQKNGGLKMILWDEWRWGEELGKRSKRFDKICQHIVAKYPDLKWEEDKSKRYEMG